MPRHRSTAARPVPTTNGAPPRRLATNTAPAIAAPFSSPVPMRVPVLPRTHSNGASTQKNNGPGWKYPKRDCTPTSGVCCPPTSRMPSISIARSDAGNQRNPMSETIATSSGSTASAAVASTTRDGVTTARRRCVSSGATTVG